MWIDSDHHQIFDLLDQAVLTSRRQFDLIPFLAVKTGLETTTPVDRIQIELPICALGQQVIKKGDRSPPDFP
jgi:hypothetical protein